MYILSPATAALSAFWMLAHSPVISVLQSLESLPVLEIQYSVAQVVELKTISDATTKNDFSDIQHPPA
jgi:hypothetical protein